MSASCPVDGREQRWIEESMTWFRSEFGEEPLRRPVVLPTPEFFPGPFSADADGILAVLERVCRCTAVDPELVTVELYGDDAETELARAAGLTLRAATAAGHYRREGGRVLIGVDSTLAGTPIRLVATIAHELCHDRLLGEGRVTEDRADHEPLTDLLTVYLGLGIFSANARFEVNKDFERYGTQSLGYLTEPMFGYGLACYAWLRGDRRPGWRRHVDTNPRASLTRGLRYLASHATDGTLES